jgi:hypothetical protein
MAYTATDLTAVRTARLRGVRTVQFGDRSVTYSSDAEMRTLEQDILRDLSLAQTATTRSKQTFGVATSKGF